MNHPFSTQSQDIFATKQEFSRVAILNRGEPAIRFIRALREYNFEKGTDIQAIAFYTAPDEEALFVRLADEAISLGPAFRADSSGSMVSSYCHHEHVIQLLKSAKCDALWPGWGFCSEDHLFVEKLEKEGIIFIGPSSHSMRLLGDKIESKRLAERARVPLAPWSLIEAGMSEEELHEIAQKVGYPLMVKASAGGGGRGIRRVNEPESLIEAVRHVENEVQKSFGQGGLFMEACLTGARHIEVQFVGNGEDGAVALGVRDCSIQRRNQKVIEEAPSPVLPPEIAEELQQASVRLANLAGYRGVGTAEFLYIPSQQRASFLEVNSRLQVEHTITEALTGCDLVRIQLELARGLKWRKPPISQSGHAIELRLNAENPEDNFRPSPGLLRVFRPPSGPGVRVDSGVVEGMLIAPEFDSMIAKVITWGTTRRQAIARAVRALKEFHVIVEDGATNKAFLLQLLKDPEFVEASADTTWLDRAVKDGTLQRQDRQFEALILAALIEYRLQWHAAIQEFFAQVQNGIPQDIPAPEGREIRLRIAGVCRSMTVYDLGRDRYLVDIEGKLHPVNLETIDSHSAILHFQGYRHRVLYSYGRTGISVEVGGAMHLVERASGGEIKAPVPAVVVHIAVEEGDVVQSGDLLCTLEVMKMEMEVRAQETGKVRSILCRPNQQVSTGQVLALLESTENAQNRASLLPMPEVEPPAFARLIDEDGGAHPEYLDDLPEDEARKIVKELHFYLESLLLGFDVAPKQITQIRTILNKEEAFAELKHPERWRSLIGLLSAFVDLESLFDRNLIPLKDEAAAMSAEPDFYEFCRRHHEGEKGAQEHLRPLLKQTLRWYGLSSLEPSDSLRESILRLVMGHSHGKLRHQICSSLLRMTLGLNTAGLQIQDDQLHFVLSQVVRLAGRHYPFVADNARQAIYVLFERPRYVQRRQTIRDFLAKNLRELQKRLDAGQSYDDLVELMATSHHSLLPLLFLEGAPLLPSTPFFAQVIMRRFYNATFLSPPSHRIEQFVDIAQLDLLLDGGESAHVIALNARPEQLIEVLSLLPQLPECQENVPEFFLEILLLGETKDASFAQKIDQIVKKIPFSCSEMRRMTISWSNGRDRLRHRTYRLEDQNIQEQILLRDIHPEAAKRIELERLQAFELERLETQEQIFAFKAQARSNPDDIRVFVFTELPDLPKDPIAAQKQGRLWRFEQHYYEGLRVIREVQALQNVRKRLHWNRFTIYVRSPIHLKEQDLSHFINHFEVPTRGLGLERVSIRGRTVDPDNPERLQPIEFIITKRGRYRLEVIRRRPSHKPLSVLTPYDMKVVRSRRFGYIYPYEIARMLEGRSVNNLTPHPDMLSGKFIEYDLDESGEKLIPVDREPGLNEAAVVVGLVSNETKKFPDGMQRVWIASDPTRAMGALAEPECRRIIAALDLAEEKQLPVEWLPISAGARISMHSGTENLDWTAKVLKKIVEFTQNGGEIHLIIAGVNVGAQSYWNAEATMLMHTKGILIMTPEASMVLTGKKALDYSGGVSAEDERCIGGFERIMGPNGQAQYFAHNLGDAYAILFDYYRFSYRKKGEKSVRKFPTKDPKDRSILEAPYHPQHGESFKTVGEIFSSKTNPGRKKPFAIREVMGATIDADGGFLERYRMMRHADTAVVWDAHIGGHAVCLIGFESLPQPRRGRIPMDGPDTWTGGTLFPQSSKKVAFAINAASDNRPVVVLANLSGFDGSPESLRKLQLEMGAEIGRAVVNFKGKFIFVVIGRYHGGAYVVFSKALNPNLTAIALEGTYASVIGGGPAAAVVFPHEVRRRTDNDPRVQEARQLLEQASDEKKPRFREKLEMIYNQVHLEKQGEVAKEFDAIHTVERAVKQGSLDEIIPPELLRPRLIELLDAPLG